MKKPRAKPTKRAPVLSAQQIVRACLAEVRAALPPEQRPLVNEQNLAARIADLVKIATQLQQARAARGMLASLGL